MSVFEIIMLICFGAAWPVSIIKSVRSKSIKGKSVVFLYIIASGYVFGILHKLYFNLDIVIYLYILNLFMVLTDLFLYYRNKRLYSTDV